MRIGIVGYAETITTTMKPLNAPYVKASQRLSPPWNAAEHWLCSMLRVKAHPRTVDLNLPNGSLMLTTGFEHHVKCRTLKALAVSGRFTQSTSLGIQRTSWLPFQT